MPKIYSIELKLSVINFYYSDLFTIENTLSIFNISKSTLYNWVNLHKNNLLNLQSNIRTPYRSKITSNVEKYIVIYVTKRISFSIKNLKKCIKRIFNIFVCKSSIYRILKINNITHLCMGIYPTF